MFFLPTASLAADLTVAVAANVQFAFDELKSLFEKEMGITVNGVIGSSGKLASQIENGAPFDVFLSADKGYPDALYRKAKTLNQPQVYAYGSLVLWTFVDLDLSKGIEIVISPLVKKIAIPAPELAPYGRQAVNALEHHHLYRQARSKFVIGESIAQTNQFITSGAAEIGFTAKSVVVAPNMKDKGKWIELEESAYEPIAQAAVILKHAEQGHLIEAEKFYEFLFSQKAQEIFQKYGYIKY